MAHPASEQATRHAQMQIPNKRQDVFDMAKLKKSLAQERRRSLVSKHKVAKLTPNEIRSLNQNTTVLNSGSIKSAHNPSSGRFAAGTPPLTPEDPPSSHQSSHLPKGKHSRSDLPTPPLSPDHEQRRSVSRTRHIHAPKPVSYAQAGHLASVTINHSRPTSATSYRGVATYRGPEMTRSGSLTMLTTPSQQIVSNPLSQFSRPRQSTLISSPQKLVPDQHVGDVVAGPVTMKPRHTALGAVSQGPSRDISPVRRSDSPVSLDDDKFPDQHAPEQLVAPEPSVVHVATKSQTENTTSEDTLEQSKKQKMNWRRTFTGTFDTEVKPKPLKKEYRRRTLMAPRNGYCLHAINYADVKAGDPPQLRNSLKNDLPSTKTAQYSKDDLKITTTSSEYEQHPSVRPLSMSIQRPNSAVSDSVLPANRKGKEREIGPESIDTDADSVTSSTPSYSRCSCCGRIQKPGGFESNLSPVLENENLRTNFSFEMERMAMTNKQRRSSSNSSNQRKYVPIIPMEVGNETRQARIELMKEATPSITSVERRSGSPLRGVIINKPGDIIGPASRPLAIMPKAKEAPKFVRFASLHMRKEEKEDLESKLKQERTENLAPPAQSQRFGSLYRKRNTGQSDHPLASAFPARGHSESAYQAQSSRLSNFSQTNGYHPLRSSSSAYEDSVPTTPVREPVAAIEKPLGDSPTSSRNDIPSPITPSYSDSDPGPMVDLSSFDGSFVNKSLSRSATLIKDVSQTDTPNGILDQPIPNGGQNMTVVEPVPHLPTGIELASQESAPSRVTMTASTTGDGQKLPTEYWSSGIESARTPTAADTEEPSGASVASNYRSTTYPTTEIYAPKPTAITTPVEQATKRRSFTTDDLPVPLNPQATNFSTTTTTMTTVSQPTTVVRFLKPEPISLPESPISTTAKGQVRLGDWLLPENSRSQHDSEVASVGSSTKDVGVAM